MPASTTDDFLTFTVGDDVLDIADHEHAVGSRTHVPARWLLDRRTQYMPLSATIKQRLVCGAQGGTGGIVLPASTTNFAFRPPAER